MAGLIDNGDFEAVTAGEFDSWTYDPTNSGAVAYVSTTPSVIGGTNSAEMIRGTTHGGILSQKFSDTGLENFTWEFDFAILPGAHTRSLHVSMYSGSSASGTLVDSLRVASNNQIEFYDYDLRRYDPTGLFAATTADTSTSGVFDGETPVVNHLKFVGTGYGTTSQSVSITLTGGTTDGTYTGTYLAKDAVTIFALRGGLCQTNFLVDNVSVAVVPEPSTFVLLGFGALALLLVRRRRK